MMKNTPENSLFTHFAVNNRESWLNNTLNVVKTSLLRKHPGIPLSLIKQVSDKFTAILDKK